MATPPTDYYATLSIPPTATQQQIRDAYKRAALKHHPDRVPSDSPERDDRTKKFQQINDAYYTLSDPTRRRDYDAARAFHGFGSNDSTSSQGPGAGAGAQFPGGFPWSAFGFGSTPAASSTAATDDEDDAESARAEFDNAQFGSVFEEMLRDEGMADGQARPTSKFWTFVGSVSGGALGFIVGNFPGAVAGAVAGNRLGAVRDAKGKSVYQVFQELEQPQKMQLLSQLAAKVFAQAVSG